MPAQYIIDNANRTVLTKFSGVLTVNEAVEYLAKLRRDPDFEPRFSELVDLTEATDIRFGYWDFNRLAEIDPFSSGSRRAFVVAARDSVFGVLRMYQTLREELIMEIFDSRDQAGRWLSQSN